MTYWVVGYWKIMKNPDNVMYALQNQKIYACPSMYPTYLDLLHAMSKKRSISQAPWKNLERCCICVLFLMCFARAYMIYDAIKGHAWNYRLETNLIAVLELCVGWIWRETVCMALIRLNLLQEKFYFSLEMWCPYQVKFLSFLCSSYRGFLCQEPKLV